MSRILFFLGCVGLASHLAAGKQELAIAATIQQAAHYFEQEKLTPLENTGGLFFFQLYNTRFFGVHKDHQHLLDFRAVRSHILQELGLPAKAPFFQIIGDCNRFSPQGTLAAKKCLENFLKDQNALVLWGYTGSALSEGNADVNELVKLWLEENPERFNYALANVVDADSVKAITQWHSSIPCQNSNFFLVYGGAKFGDDVHSSDILTDSCLVLNGGVQTFRQIINLLARDVPIQGLYNLRSSTEYFSAAEFLDFLKSAASLEELEELKNAYFKTHALLRPDSPKDARSRQALFDAGWKQLIDQELWRKLSSCHFKNAMMGSTTMRDIPKVELHLHLTGAYPLNYVQSLATPDEQKSLENSLQKIASGIDYHEGFSIFGLIEKIVNSEEKVENGVAALCRSLKEDGVVYAEIRTGLKDLGKGHEQYLLAVLRGMEREISDRFHARLLLSVRRNSPLDYAKTTVDLALKYKDRNIVGIDISGNSTVGEIQPLLLEILRAKENGLYLTLHLGEHPDEKNQKLLLEILKPHRIGHGVHLETEALKWMLDNKVPLEVCLTSSKCVKMIEKDAQHPGLSYYFRDHPIVICTDDPLIFSTSLSEELHLFQKSTSLPLERVHEFAINSLDHAFLTEEEKNHLREIFFYNTR